MKTRLLFFDDEPKTAKDLQGQLENQGYILAFPKTLEEAFHEINSNGAELLIHAAHTSKTHWSLVEEIFNQYPQFPSIHITNGSTSEMYNFRLKGPFHKNVRPLGPVKEFLKNVRRLVFLGRMARQNAALSKVVKLQNKIDEVFETLELNDLKTKSVEFFAEHFKAKNAYFLSTGGYGFYLNQMWKVAPLTRPDPSLQKHALCSAKPSSESELSSILTETSKQLSRGWELKHNRVFIQGQKSGRGAVWFVPLIGNNSKKILGHVMLVEPLLYGDQALEKVLPYLTRVLGRHLEHVLTYTSTKNLTYVDDLTELYNQRYLKIVLDKEISRAAKAGTSFSVLFMDIDHFKQVNDTKGHLVGSRILMEMAKIFRQAMRSTDFAFRYGGDEFLLILVGSDSNQALGVAERIRKQVESAIFEIREAKIKVTLSIGIATYPDHATTKEEIIELADRAMYCGKNISRNVVYVAS